MNTMPTWAATILVILLALMMASLAALVVLKAITEALKAEGNLQQKRRDNETKALNKWQKLYEEEREERLNVNAQLIAEIVELQCENKRMKALLERTKVVDLGRD